MNTVCEKDKCTGDMECIDICHKGAIQIADSGMEYNAIIDSDKCIKCNVCHKACQNNRKQELTRPIYWKQGWEGTEPLSNNSDSACKWKSKENVIGNGIIQSGCKRYRAQQVRMDWGYRPKYTTGFCYCFKHLFLCFADKGLTRGISYNRYTAKGCFP